MDNRLIFLYLLYKVMGRRSSERHADRRNCPLKGVVIFCVGKSARDDEPDST